MGHGLFRNKKKSNEAVFRFTQEIAQLSTSYHDDKVESLLLDPEPMFGQRMDRYLGLGIAGRRFRIAFALLVAIVLLFAARAAHVQLVEGDGYRAIAEGNRFRVSVIPAPRGTVADRAGQMLIENVPAFTLLMDVTKIPTDSIEREAVFERVSDLSGLQRTDIDLILQEYASAQGTDVIVRKNLDYTNAMLLMVEEDRLPGFSVKVLTRRQYSSRAPSLSHVLGYTGNISADEYARFADVGYRRTDEIGKAGVEKSLEAALRGVPGEKVVEVDAYGEETTTYAQRAPVDGADIQLSIDLELQVELENRLLSTLEALGTKKASAIVMNPQNGQVLALASLPTFDSNVFGSGIDRDTYARLVNDPAQPLFARAISGEFPSGSTFKPFVAAAALAEGLIDARTSFLSRGGIAIGEWFFPDWRAGGHGVTDVRKAIAESVNTFFYTIGGGYDQFQGLGVERITKYAALFGFGSPTGINLPSEADGFLPSKEWKEETKNERWYVGDTYHLAIGQGDLLATPLQLVSGIATIANGGTRWTPSVLYKVSGQEQQSDFIELDGKMKAAIDIVREGMRQTVTSGSARRLNSLPIAVAGKTGTAQIGGDRTHAWFAGFAPYENPEIAIVVLFEEGGEGSSVAVPVAEKIFAWWAKNRME